MKITRLIQDSIDANGTKCPAGTTISPDVSGWPDHRVKRHIAKGWAREVQAAEGMKGDGPGGADTTVESPKGRSLRKK